MGCFKSSKICVIAFAYVNVMFGLWNTWICIVYVAVFNEVSISNVMCFVWMRLASMRNLISNNFVERARWGEEKKRRCENKDNMVVYLYIKMICEHYSNFNFIYFTPPKRIHTESEISHLARFNSHIGW